MCELQKVIFGVWMASWSNVLHTRLSADLQDGLWLAKELCDGIQPWAECFMQRLQILLKLLHSTITSQQLEV